ncbi:hypothetical protein A2246_03780 [candidate division WOR-1 bacterium RIFOXYA2_FULL_37_7]|nr:MAG: hypothetical protein A2246_03780 [candidate division WOR-1 bacterium RIFOXYA2_FULL_37_7]
MELIYSMKIKFYLFLLIFFLFQLTSFSSENPVLVEEGEFSYNSFVTLEKIRFGQDNQKLRIVMDFSNLAYYNVATKEGELDIYLFNSKSADGLPDLLEINDFIAKYIKLEKYKEGLLLRIFLKNHTSYNIFSLEIPSRLVVDFGRTFTRAKEQKQICDGIDLYNIEKSVGSKLVTAQVLEVDPEKVLISPAVFEPEVDFLGSVLRFFNPKSQEKQPGFCLGTVSKIAEQKGAIAAVNGTYFSWNGVPLGVFMINGEIISYPIFDRTALVITEDKGFYIDNITMDSYFQHGEVKYAITGINEPSSSNKDIVLYTPRYGAAASAKGTAFNIVVKNGEVESLSSGNTIIPSDGFIISAGDMYTEFLSSSVKREDKIKVVINIIPYSTSIKGNLLHLIGGGPRLLKSGRIYISKYQEKFRSDIAKGRAARTAAGITDGGKLLFVTVDGKLRKGEKEEKSASSAGMSLTELAYFMQSLGAVDALNLDGGGSSTMVVNGKVRNNPVDGNQRKVGNAILIKPLY